MKKIFAFATLLLTGAMAMVSCSDDNDSNPTLVQPATFSINEVAEAQGQVDLMKSYSVVFRNFMISSAPLRSVEQVKT